MNKLPSMDVANRKSNNNQVCDTSIHDNFSLFFAMYIIAFLLRFIFTFTLPENFIWSDETAYYNIAVNLYRGEGFSNNNLLIPKEYLGTTLFNSKDSFYAAPGLPWFLAAMFYAFGEGIWTARFSLIAVSSILPILIFKICIFLHNRKSTAIVGGFIAAVYPYYVYLSPISLPQSIFTVLLASSLFFYISWIKSGRIRWIIFTSLAVAVSGLFVVPMIFTIIPISISVIFKKRLSMETIITLVSLSIVFFLIVGSYIIYASVVNDRFTLITKQSDNAVIKYNHSKITTFEVLSHRYTRESMKETNLIISEYEKNYQNKSFLIIFLKDIISEHSLLFIRNCVLRLIALFSPVTFTISKNIHTGIVSNIIGVFIYLPIFIFSIIGFIKMLFKKSWYLISIFCIATFYFLPYIIVIGSTRYRLPWDSVMLCFGAEYLTSAAQFIFKNIKSIPGYSYIFNVIDRSIKIK